MTARHCIECKRIHEATRVPCTGEELHNMYSEGGYSTRGCGACQNCIFNGHNQTLKDSQPVTTETRASAAIVSPDLFFNIVVCEISLLSDSMPLDVVSIFQMSGATIGKSNRLRISASAPVSMPVRPTCAHNALHYMQDSKTLYTQTCLPAACICPNPVDKALPCRACNLMEAGAMH
ncbi:TPA: hypothetical protein ACH3X2_005646 [Trebouxia sp. C0005]